MSTATAFPTLGDATAARDFLAQKVQWLRALAAKLIAALAKPLEFVKAVKNSAATVIRLDLPVPLVTAVSAATLATESGYERVRGTAYAALTGAGRLLGTGVRFMIGAAARTVSAASSVLGDRVHSKVDAVVNRVATTAFRTWNAVAAVSSTVTSHIFCALGHRTAVRIITTAASIIAMATSVEVLTTVTGLPTLSGLLTATPLAGTVATSVLTSTGLGMAALGVAVIVGGTVAWLTNRTDVNDMVRGDTTLRQPAVPDETMETVLAEADALKAEKEGLESVIRRTQRPRHT